MKHKFVNSLLVGRCRFGHRKVFSGDRLHTNLEILGLKKVTVIYRHCRAVLWEAQHKGCLSF